MNKPLILSFDRNMSKSRVNGMDSNVSVCIDKETSKKDQCMLQ